MMKKWFAGLFLAVLFVSFSFAQNGANWEFLEVSGVGGCNSVNGKECRTYYYRTSGTTLSAQSSLEWMKESGWELVGVAAYEQYYGLYFKRQYNKTRTENEIDRLKKEFEKDLSKPSPADNPLLVDLDTLESRQKQDSVNKNEAAKLRTALEQINDLPLKIVSVASTAFWNGQTRVGAELVLDATSVLLKDGNQYRSSDADKYFKETARQILDKIKVTSDNPIETDALRISKGSSKPRIGNFNFYDGVSLKISAVVNYKNQQIVVAQSVIRGKWTANPQ